VYWEAHLGHHLDNQVLLHMFAWTRQLSGAFNN
jgi:hypothetical protein